MPEFCNIKKIKTPKEKLSKVEVLRAIKFGIASEFESIQIYQQIMESTESDEVKKVLSEIAEDEKKHAGGLFRLLEILSPEDAKLYKAGAAETDEEL